jgi:hypothetical protein
MTSEDLRSHKLDASAECESESVDDDTKKFLAAFFCFVPSSLEADIAPNRLCIVIRVIPSSSLPSQPDSGAVDVNESTSSSSEAFR